MPDPKIKITRRKIKRGKYKKKKRIELTPREKRNSRLTYDILSGMPLEAAAATHGFNSRQSAQKQFRLTVVNFFLPSQKKEIINKNYNIKYLRKIWRESLI